METYELMIGCCRWRNPSQKKIFRKESFTAVSLNVAKRHATKILKSLPEMHRYFTYHHGRNVKWEVWCKETKDKHGFFFTNKKSALIYDNPKSFGFCQLRWDGRQMQLFENVGIR